MSCIFYNIFPQKKIPLITTFQWRQRVDDKSHCIAYYPPSPFNSAGGMMMAGKKVYLLYHIIMRIHFHSRFPFFSFFLFSLFHFSKRLNSNNKKIYWISKKVWGEKIPWDLNFFFLLFLLYWMLSRGRWQSLIKINILRCLQWRIRVLLRKKIQVIESWFSIFKIVTWHGWRASNIFYIIQPTYHTTVDIEWNCPFAIISSLLLSWKEAI